MPISRRQSPRVRMMRERERRQSQVIERNFKNIAANFENDMVALRQQNCPSCKRQFMTTDVNASRCSMCTRSQDRAFLYSSSNEMDPGPVPAALQGLTMLEEILIARVHPVISVFKIHGQQRAYTGHVMNFNQYSETIATRLPNDPRTLNSILILNRETPSGIVEFRVRSLKIREALNWLKNNNIYYNDIQIDESVLQELPEDGDIADSLPLGSASTNSTIDAPEAMRVGLPGAAADNELAHDNILSRSCFPDIPNANAADQIIRNVENSGEEINIGDWPDLSQNRLNEFTSEGLICRAFPTLFPYGKGDLRCPRIQTISPHKYFKFLMEYHDRRFANHSRFPYYAYNTLARWDAMNCGSVFVRLNNFEGMDVEDVTEIVNNPAHHLATNIMYYGSTLRGTKPFWKQRCAELLQMVRQLGCPSIFFTLSAADYHWPDLFRILARTERTDTIDENTRRTLMHENPSTVAQFFEKRCDLFVKKFMTKFFKIEDFWYRYEWQHRGSPHIHGLLWLEDAPDCSNIDFLDENEKQAIVDYFDDMVSASIGRIAPVRNVNNPCRQRLRDLSIPEEVHDLDRLLNAVQRHSRCGSHCLRRRRGGSRAMECRYKFPLPLESRSTLRQEMGSWQFFPKRNDPLLQRYNSFITRVWRGNTDFSPVTSKDAVINYIAKYASKAECSSGSYSDIFKEILSRHQPSTRAATVIQSLLMSTLNERNYSAQEVQHLLMGWPLYHSSRSIIVLSVKDDWRRYGQRNQSSLVTYYSQREVHMRDLSLLEFSKKYRYSAGRMILRRKEAVVRVVPYIKEPELPDPNHEYFILQCKLNVPWRGQFESIKPAELTWRDLYMSHIAMMEVNEEFIDEFPQVPDEFEHGDDDDDAEVMIRDAGMAAARLRPASQENDQVGMRNIDVSYTWRDITFQGLSNTDIDEFLLSFRPQQNNDQSRVREEPEIDLNSMSPEQMQVIDALRSQLDGSGNIKRILVQGKAGTGKSALIKYICHVLATELGSNSFQVLAPTGAAALNISGKTIHNFLRVPINSQMAQLNGIQLRSFQLQMSSIKYILIDEYSMIGLRMFAKIHKRLCEAKGSGSDPFGGYNVFLFGDLRQLPPVRDTAMYMQANDDLSTLGKRLTETFQRKVILQTCFRQGQGQEIFRDMLDNVARGTVTQAHWQLLNSRRTDINSHLMPLFRQATYLYATNAEVRAHNDRVLAANRRPVAIINAKHNNPTARQGTDDQAQGLTRVLKLSIGSRIMLRKNISVSRGLVNGSLGKIIDIVYMSGERPPSLPYALIIDFDDFTGPYFIHPHSPRTFPLLPMTSNWKDQTVECSRKQFPINLADSVTIHKSQGLTLARVVADIGAREIAPGASYVALSRVRRLEDLLTRTFCDFNRLNSLSSMLHIRQREMFLNNFNNQ